MCVWGDKTGEEEKGLAVRAERGGVGGRVGAKM